MKTISNILIIISFLLFTPAMALAQTQTNEQIFAACKNAPSSSICQDRIKQNQDPETNPVIRLIRVAASIVAILTGIAAVIFIILGGLTMVTSAGNTEAVANARKRIIYAVVGLVVVALAWAIITFLTDRLI